jgi:hypothetical protein
LTIDPVTRSLGASVLGWTLLLTGCTARGPAVAAGPSEVAGRADAGVRTAANVTLTATGPASTASATQPNETWWMRQTDLQPGGKLDLRTKPWWPRAAQLKVGEQFLLDADGQPTTLSPATQTAPAGIVTTARPARMLVRREHLRNATRECDAIVWVIDDDEDGSILTKTPTSSPAAAAGASAQPTIAMPGDTDSDCYVADYDCDGLVDRMVDYIDSNGDGRAEEMDIRYFEGGELRSVWCGEDHDGDGKMWDLAGYEYSHNFFASDPYGNNMIYMNKYDPQHGSWLPISECPFSFYDTDGDGFSEVVLRVSAAPIDYSTTTDPDYANDAGRYRGKFTDDMRKMGAVNVRYSYDIDNASGPKSPLHYDCGFNLVGSVPYAFAGQQHFNAQRRPPQTTCVLPFDSGRKMAETYAAAETGFTWHEQHDDTISIGDGPLKDLDYRWEGVFWMWERRFMGNTGGPCQKWNVRREWSGKPATSRELYYSDVDRRIHLFGASEGWIQIGRFGGQGEIGEIRMFDTDGNGYFDRWEVYLGDSPSPARITTVRDERARRIPSDYASLAPFYTKEVLPQALAANEKLIAAIQTVRPFEVPAGLTVAMTSGSDNDRRFARDVVRELAYAELRKHLSADATRVLRQSKKDDLRPLKHAELDQTINSQTAWRLTVALEKLDTAYGQGDDAAATAALNEISSLTPIFRSSK